MTDINYNRKRQDSDYIKEYKKKRIVDKGISKEDHGSYAFDFLTFHDFP